MVALIFDPLQRILQTQRFTLIRLHRPLMHPGSSSNGLSGYSTSSYLFIMITLQMIFFVSFSNAYYIFPV
jgi:hypothetical protein